MTDGAVPALVVRDLVKVFPGPEGGELRAVDGISFEVYPGEVFGFLGPNGAGKSTTLEIIEGLQEPTSGSVEIFGMDVRTRINAIKPILGVQLQTENYFDMLQLQELLELFASFYGVKADADEFLEMVGLTEKRKAPVKNLSGGQKRRFSIALSLVHRPKIVFLDEPTSGLDPQARRRLWDTVSNIRDAGTTVVITTHYMDEAETLSDRVAIIDHGKIRAVDTPLRLVQSLDSAYHLRFSTDAPTPEPALLKLPGAVSLNSREADGTIRSDLEVKDPAQIVEPFMKAMKRAKLAPQDLRIEPSTLEDVFLSLTGRELRD